MTGVLVAVGLVVVAIVVSRVLVLGLERELAVTAIRAIVQLTVVGLVVTAVFESLGLAAGFVALMFGAAAFTSSRRMREIPRPLVAGGGAIALGAATGLIPLLASGAFELTPRELIPIAGILIGGAMAATSITGRRLLDDVQASVPQIETRLALGAPVQAALRPVVRRAARAGLIPVLDQTKNVGLVTLPGHVRRARARRRGPGRGRARAADRPARAARRRAGRRLRLCAVRRPGLRGTRRAARARGPN